MSDSIPTGSSAIIPSPAWGSQGGFLHFPEVWSDKADVSDADHDAVVERVHRYGWAFDERLASELSECFTDDAVWSGNIMGLDGVDPVAGREAIVNWLSGFWQLQDDQRRHMMTSVLVSNCGPTSATAVSSLLLTSARGSRLEVVLTSFYAFELTRESGVWRIRRLFEGCDRPF